MAAEVGKKIKELRTNKKLTLKDMSEKTNLSIGFLSQLERGLTSVAIDSLEKIAEVLEVDLHYFFGTAKSNKKHILRRYEQKVFQVENSRLIHYNLTNDLGDKDLLPRLIEILPSGNEENITTYQHEGEEFIYVLEGILTLFLDNEHHELYPGDSAHFSSNIFHNWANYTNKVVRIISINTPNFLK